MNVVDICTSILLERNTGYQWMVHQISVEGTLIPGFSHDVHIISFLLVYEKYKRGWYKDDCLLRKHCSSYTVSNVNRLSIKQ